MDHEQKKEVDLLDYLNVIVKHRRAIMRNVLVVALFIGVVSFLLPSTYTARTTILPPEDLQSPSILTELSSSPSLSNLLFTGAGTTSDLYVEILKSRSVLDAVLQKEFSYRKSSKNPGQRKLLSILKQKSLEKGRLRLASRIHVKSSAEGIITLDVELGDRHLASDVANALVVELDKINKEKNTSRSKNSRIYLENQLKDTKAKLKDASEALVKFKEKYKAIALEEQTQTAIESIGELKGRIVAKNVELGVARQSMKSDNVVVVKIRKEIEELEKQYRNLQFGDDDSTTSEREIYIPIADVPAVGLELAELVREEKVQETVWELLNQQYYQAKLQEARDTPTIQVLDEAVPPEQRTKPKRKILVLVGSFLALILSIFGAFVVEFVHNLKQDDSAQGKAIGISSALTSDWIHMKNYSRAFIQKLKFRKKSRFSGLDS
ncbi:MAG: GumC family protein [Candidatus Zhuqueibacterota bacterium]